MTAILAIMFATAVLSLVVIAIAVRRAWLARDPVRVLWALPQVAYIAAFAWGLLTNGAGYSARAILITVVIAFPASIAYLVEALKSWRGAVAARREDETPAVGTDDDRQPTGTDEDQPEARSS